MNESAERSEARAHDIVFDPSNPEAYLARAGELNADHEFRAAIAMLEAIPTEYLTDRIRWNWARTLQNLAVLGERDGEELPAVERNALMAQSVELLRQMVDPDKENGAGWNMAMAFGYYYQGGKDLQALVYAKRWAKLAPENESAPALMRDARSDAIEVARAMDDAELERNTCEVLDDAAYHTSKPAELNLPVSMLAGVNHMAIFLRWAFERNLMHPDFVAAHADEMGEALVSMSDFDLRRFILEKLDGRLLPEMFVAHAALFADYYYDMEGSLFPSYASDVDEHALRYFGPERYHSDEFKTEAYLFVPYDETYYREMAEIIEHRFSAWFNMDIDESGVESAVKETLGDAFEEECVHYIPPMTNRDPHATALEYGRRLAARTASLPLLLEISSTVQTMLERNTGGAPLTQALLAAARERFSNAELPTFNDVREARKSRGACASDKQEAAPRAGLEHAEPSEAGIEAAIDAPLASEFTAPPPSEDEDGPQPMTRPFFVLDVKALRVEDVLATVCVGGVNHWPTTTELMAIVRYLNDTYGAVPAIVTSESLGLWVPKPLEGAAAQAAADDILALCLSMRAQGIDVDTLAEQLGTLNYWTLKW